MISNFFLSISASEIVRGSPFRLGKHGLQEHCPAIRHARDDPDIVIDHAHELPLVRISVGIWMCPFIKQPTLLQRHPAPANNAKP